MSRSTVAPALLLVAVAAVLQIGLGVPARRDRDEARTAYARGREERERLRARVAELERSAATESASVADPAAAVRALRASLLRATDGLPVGSIQIAATPGDRRQVAARGRLAVNGPLADALVVTGRLARPTSGVLLERVRLTETRAASGQVRLEVEGFSIGAGS